MPVQAILVDDDPIMLQLLADMLARLGITKTRLTSNAERALELFRTDETARVCFLDLHMPGMDGLELIRHLSSESSCAGVVLMSGEEQRILNSAAALASAQGLRVLATLRKPIELDTLRRALDKLLGPSSTRRAPTPSSFVATSADLRRGILAGELVVHYQPRVSLVTGACRGAEALVRWQHPEAGLVAPAEFVGLAETSGLIDLLTHHVFTQGIRDVGELREQRPDLGLSLNANIDTLARLEFADELIALATRYRVPLRSLTIEVTESGLVVRLERALETLTRLRLKRVGIAIDDFGTGYSSMDQLRRFPFTELKLEGSFVRGAGHDKTTRAILASSIMLAEHLGMSGVAEGVETREEWDLVATLGCDEAQGYFMAKPMSKSDFGVWLSTWHSPPKAVALEAHS